MPRCSSLAIETLETRRLLSAAHPLALRQPPQPPLSGIQNWCYQLQNIDLKAIARSRFDMAVIDYSEDGSDQQAFTRRQIVNLESSGRHGKLVLAYLSIGEAENYRFYWNSAWTNGVNGPPSASAPSWLGPEDSQWSGNYYVKYWDPAWQSIVTSYLNKIMGNGYDGCYLDVIDAYQFWGPGGDSGLNYAPAEKDMAHFVEDLAAYARSIDPNFKIFVQNGEDIASTYPSYAQDVDGIAEEDTWFDGNTPIDRTDTNYTIEDLDIFQQAGKPVFCIDYVTRKKTIDEFYADAQAQGFVPYSSDLNLDTLTINPGHAPR